MVAPAVVAAGVSGAASLLGGILGNRANKNAAQAQMEFQERMRATQYQTAVSDLKAAGLNPMLAYTQGGAGTPSGASYKQEDVVSPAVSSAGQMLSMLTQLENTTADTGLKKAETENKNASNAVLQAQAANILEDTYLKNRLARLYAYQGTSAYAKSYHDEKTIPEAIAATLSQYRQTINREPESKASGDFWRGAGDWGSVLTGAKNVSEFLPWLRMLRGGK